MGPGGRRKHAGTHRYHCRLSEYADLLHGLAGVDRPCSDDRASLNREVGDIHRHAHTELGCDARCEVLPCGRRSEHDRAVAARLRALRDGAGAPLGSGRPTNDRIDRRAQACRRRHDLVRNLAQGPIALLEHRERRHKTLASSRSSRTSSATAPAPSPTIFPSFRSGGGVSATTSRTPAPTCTGFTSSGFFFAAMMPLSAGKRGSFRPLSVVRTAGSGKSTTSMPPSISRSAIPFVPSMSRWDTALTHGSPSSSATSGPT